MDLLERNFRDKMIKVLFILVWSCITLDICFFLVFYFTDSLGVSVPVYILKYLCLPFGVNMTTFLITRHINNSPKRSHDFKNLACSLGLCTLGGSMGIFHSYYTPLWCIPAMVLLFCSVFHSRKIHHLTLVYSCILVCLAAAYISLERPSQASFYIQHCVVVLGITILSSLVANEVRKYQKSVETLILTATKNEEEYRMRLERDLLTGVHSREYMREVANRTFGIAESTDPVGIAILDLDDFKKINDKYGHDNGDKVLRALGALLNKYAGTEFEAGRFGGEEFIIILRGLPQENYVRKLEEIRKQFCELSFDFMSEKVSFSSGVVTCTTATIYEKAFHLADQALYSAKGNGKNQTISVSAR